MKSISSNVKTAVAASTICLVLILAIALLSAKPSSDTILKRPSTFFTDPTGARAIYMVLRQVLPSAGQWRLPVTDLREPSPSSPTTLIAMEPNPFGQAEANSLDQWIASGGQLILASNTDWHVQKSQSDKTVKDFLSRHGIQAGSQPAKSAIDAVVVQAVGRGRIIYVPDSYAFSNEALRKSDNAVWLVQRCAEWNGGGVLFDEYHHNFGAQRSLIALIAMFAVTPWGLVCVQLGLAGAIYMVGCKRRFGRPQEELPAERTNPIESVRALAGLFETAQARALSARAMHQYLNAQVSSIMGYRIDLMNEEARNRLAGPLRIEKAVLDSYAEEARNAISKNTISDAELIRFGQKTTAIARSFSYGAGRNKRSAAAG